MSAEDIVEATSGLVSFQQRLQKFAEELRNGEKVPPVSVRELLSWVGWQRRGTWITWWIKNAIEKADLTTVPDFRVPYIDALIEFRLAEQTARMAAGTPTDDVVVALTALPIEEVASSAPTIADPTYRIERLRSANITPTTVSPNHTVAEAITIMLTNDFSQLPVMVGEREVKGVISWGSIGSRLALGVRCSEVRECMEPAYVISADTSLLDAITEIVNHQYVLVRDSTNKISGIVTTSDLGQEFRLLTEPFVLLREIENHVRNLINRGNFTQDQMRECCDPNDSAREIDGVFDLTFGEYLRILENKELWSKLNLSMDRNIFNEKLDKIREIRNDVMHFDPDGISDTDLDALRKFVIFLQKLQPILQQ